MSDKDTKEIKEIYVDSNNLYREENFTDLKVASIRRLIPVKPDGSDDKSRAPIFMGQASMMTGAGPMPIQFPLDANNFKEAMDNFPEAVKKAVEKMIEEVKELQRKEASRIIVPGKGPGPVKLD